MVYYVNLATGGYVKKSTLVEARATAIRSMEENMSRVTLPIVSSTEGLVGQVIRAPKTTSGYAWVGLPGSSPLVKPLYKNGKIARGLRI